MQKSVHHPEYRRLISLLTAARKQAKLSQEALAVLIDEHQNFISKYETFEQRLDLQEFATIARALRFDWVGALAEYEKDYLRRLQDEKLDAELEQTFPASDPLPYRRDAN